MTDSAKREANPLSYLPHEGTEFTDHAPPDAMDTADDAIRMVMTEQKREVSRKSLPEIAPDLSPEVLAPAPRRTSRIRSTKSDGGPRRVSMPLFIGKPVQRVREGLRARLAALLPVGRASRASGQAPKNGRAASQSLPSRLVARVTSYRPTRKHVFWAVVAGIMIWRPWLLPIVALTLFLVVVIAYLSIGPDRVAEMVSDTWMKLAAKRPDLAERLRERAHAGVTKLDAFIAVLPGNWTERVTLPDFSKSLEERLAEEESRPDPFERLAAEAHRA